MNALSYEMKLWGSGEWGVGSRGIGKRVGRGEADCFINGLSKNFHRTSIELPS
jgi:hypothetical protein